MNPTTDYPFKGSDGKPLGPFAYSLNFPPPGPLKRTAVAQNFADHLARRHAALVPLAEGIQRSVEQLPRFTLYIAQATFPHQWEPASAFLFRIIAPDGSEVVTAGSDPAAPVRTREANPFYTGFLAALAHVPKGAELVVITLDQQLYGTPTRPGTFNTSPAEREKRRYLRANPKDGPLGNVEQLREIDAVLTARGITTSARKPETVEEERHYVQVAGGAKGLLRVKPAGAASQG